MEFSVFSYENNARVYVDNDYNNEQEDKYYLILPDEGIYMLYNQKKRLLYSKEDISFIDTFFSDVKI